MFLPNLTSNVMYEVKIRGATRSLFSPTKIYPGQFSEFRKILVAPDCDRIAAPIGEGINYNQEIELSAGMVAALVCASFALILVLLAFVLWRKYFQVKRKRGKIECSLKKTEMTISFPCLQAVAVDSR